MSPAREACAPSLSLDPADDRIKLIRKLRWIGMEEEAQRLQQAVSAGSASPSDVGAGGSAFDDGLVMTGDARRRNNVSCSMIRPLIECSREGGT